MERSENELLIGAENGAAVIGPVAVALHGSGVQVQEIVLRTATLDDVFFEVTGARIEADPLDTTPPATEPSF